MSGGHWEYLAYRLEERGLESREVWRLMAVLEHELYWGICGDTCRACARNRMAPALEAFFDHHADDATLAIAVARDYKQHRCEKCEEREAKRGV